MLTQGFEVCPNRGLSISETYAGSKSGLKAIHRGIQFMGADLSGSHIWKLPFEMQPLFCIERCLKSKAHHHAEGESVHERRLTALRWPLRDLSYPPGRSHFPL